jgi:hypothetical protein
VYPAIDELVVVTVPNTSGTPLIVIVQYPSDELVELESRMNPQFCKAAAWAGPPELMVEETFVSLEMVETSGLTGIAGFAGIGAPDVCPMPPAMAGLTVPAKNMIATKSAAHANLPFFILLLLGCPSIVPV